jgi:hypothetical protein
VEALILTRHTNNNMADEVKETLRSWIAADDEIRALQAQIKTIRDRKNQLGVQVLSYMKDNDLANFVLDGPGGTIARSERVSRPALKRSTLRQQLFLQFADQPERVAEALRAIEGIPEGGDDMSVGGTKRDILSRRLPRSQNISLN